ncbi:hypothetical protein ACWDE9_46670 [Streptomyces olivaceoviridis]
MHSWQLRHIRERLINDFLAEQKRQRDEFDERLADIDRQIREAEAAEDQNRSDPMVLVRNSVGAPRRVYHDADDPCGRTKHGGREQQGQGFTPMRESDAKKLDGGALTRCTACWNPYN